MCVMMSHRGRSVTWSREEGNRGGRCRKAAERHSLTEREKRTGEWLGIIKRNLYFVRQPVTRYSYIFCALKYPQTWSPVPQRSIFSFHPSQMAV